MFDFGLTSKGDLIFEKNVKRQPLKINFNITRGKAFNIKFKLEDCPALVGSPNSMKISFDIKEVTNDKKALILDGDEADIQAIKIRLLSSLGEIAGREAIGSKLELVKHCALYEKNTSDTTVKYVKEAIADILPDAEVRVKPVITRTEHGYDQKLSIYIYDNGYLIFKYDLKG